MDEERLYKIKRIVIGAVIAVLIAGMAAMLHHSRAKMSARSQRIASLVAEANAYETELNELRRQQELEEMHIYKPEGPGAAVVAFLIDGENTLRTALSYGQTYGFTPSILLRTDDPDVDTVIEAITNTGLEVILYSRGIGTPAQIRALQERVDDANCANTYSYLLRAGDDTDETRQVLNSAGIRTLFLYGDSLTGRVTEEGTTELNYSYINRSSYTPANRLSDLNGSEQGLLFAFDLVDTTVTARQMDEILAAIRDEADSGHIAIGSVQDAVQTVENRQERENANLADFLEVQEARSARIEELEEIIKEIYSHWDD
ncbi:MAG: hypothetical protein K5981_01810 [Clostridia bacterium]|nr:hypothetical protein [Clostridia bacterium]